MRVFFDKSDIRTGPRKSARKLPPPREPQTGNIGEAVVATVWLAFYAIAIAVAVASPFVSRAIE